MKLASFFISSKGIDGEMLSISKEYDDILKNDHLLRKERYAIIDYMERDLINEKQFYIDNYDGIFLGKKHRYKVGL